MHKVENFETKLFSNDDGWKIWLCTERDEIKLSSFFKVQYPVKGTPQRDTKVIPITGYYDTTSAIKNQLLSRRQFVHYAVGTTYLEDEYSKWFLETMFALIDAGTLIPALKEHNRKTIHRLHLIPGYSGQDEGSRTYTVYHDTVSATLAKFTITPKEDDGYEMAVLCIGDAKGRMVKTDHVYTEPMTRPESLSNALFRVFNPLLDEMQVDKEERMDIVADITHHFEKCRFGFWDLLNKINKK
ncbi:hypothetical protein pETSU_119 [Edwardsiella phage pEt-SU]|uniref:Uncharacterized protein n=1 Tax=Edwardsiella phage pEt-SU TaxID=2562142 RepID=A0A4D6DWI5_9CAUD|nr:hypothetical protein HOV39_gp119 [Edwardsiella phage pEt-SU]QBZ70700.1 hypothetical protein pETSU_119 [Edwardsiella phage pEt-SU]